MEIKLQDKEVSTATCLLNRSMPLDVSYRVIFSVWNCRIVKHLISNWQRKIMQTATLYWGLLSS